MGVVRSPAITDYLERLLETQPNVRNESEPVSAKSNDISMSRLQCPPPPPPAKSVNGGKKMEPMSSIAQKRFHECYLPSINLSIDEMMVKCQGRSAHTLIMKNKPISQGYKLFAFALADHGYIYLFLGIPFKNEGWFSFGECSI